MPSMANITVKATNGTTDVIYVAKSPSSGDTVPSRWKADALGGAVAFSPELHLSFKDNGPRTARRGRLDFRWVQTYTDTTTGLVKIANWAPGFLELLLPKEMPAAQTNEAVDQYFNLISSPLIRQCFKEGYAAT